MLTTAAALPLGNIIMFGYLLVARGDERDQVMPFAVCAVATIGGGLVAVAAAGPRVDLVAAALLGGGLLGMGMLALRFVRRAPELRGAAVEASALAAVVSLLAVAALAEELHTAIGIALLVIAAATLWRLAPAIRSLLPRAG